MSGLLVCDRAILFPLSFGQMCGIAGLKKSRPVAHWFVNNELARR